MSNRAISIIQWVTLIFWLGVVLNLWFVFTKGSGQIFIALGALLCIIHFIEYVFLRFKMRKPISFFKTMIFGCGHWLPVMEK